MKDGKREPEPDPASLRAAYDQISESHRAIVTFRAKLLGFLPLASLLTLFGFFNSVYGTKSEKILAPLGILGFVVTFALLLHELRGIEDCTRFRKHGAMLECKLHIEAKASQFRCWPPGKIGIVDEIGAAFTIYFGVLAAWAFFALRGFERYFDWWPSYWKVLIIFGLTYGGLLLAALAAYPHWIFKEPTEPIDPTTLPLPKAATTFGGLLAVVVVQIPSSVWQRFRPNPRSTG
jgi:hypothetical protein